MTDLVPAPAPVPGATWPTTPRAFTDTALCPRCFSVLPSSRCAACGLELAVPRAAQLIALSTELVEAEQRRRELIDLLWSEQLAAQAEALAQTRAVAPPLHAFAPDAAVAAAAGVPSAPAATPPFPSSQTARPAVPAAPAGPTAPAAPRPSGVQVFLLVTGIVLLSVFALFFLTVAYLFATVEVRVIVTALAGLVVFAVAWLLAHRRLPATGEGVGVAGAAILIGTLGFIRGAEVFGSAAVSPTLFWGGGLVVLAALLVVLHRLTSLRFARIGSLILMPTGIALVVIGAVSPVDTGLAWWAGLSAAGASTLLVRGLTGRRAEAALLRSLAFTFSTAALIPAALLLPDVPGIPAATYAICALVWGAFSARLRRESDAAAWSNAASVLLGLSVALAPAVATLREASTGFALWAPGAAAGLVATVFVVLARGSTNVAARRTLTWAQGPALVVAAIGLFPSVVIASVHVLGSLVPQYSLWGANPDDPIVVVFEIGAWAAVLGPAVAATLGAVAIRLGNLPKAARAIVGGLSALALLAAASHGGTVLLVLSGYLVVAGACLAVLLFTRRRSASAAQVPAAVALGMATLALVVLSHASAALWLPAVLAAALLVVATRHGVATDGPARRPVRAALTALAIALILAEATLLAPWISGLPTGAFVVELVASSPIDFVGIPGILSALLLVAAPFLVRRSVDGRATSNAADVRAAAIVAFAVATICSIVAFVTTVTPATTPPEHVARIAIPLILAVAGVLWQRRAPVEGFVERVVLASLAPLAIASALVAVASLVGPSSALVGDYLGGPVAAILSATAGLLIFARASTGLRAAARIAWQSATALVIAVAAARTATNVGEATWLILLLLAVAPLIVALGAGNPFTSAAPRRHFVIASCILAVAALWQFLVFRGVTDVEPYSLPVAGLLLGIAAASAVFGRRSATPVAGRSTLFAVGLLVALGPSALPAIIGSPARGVVLLVIATALVAAALVAPRVIRAILVRDSVLIVAIAILVVVGSAGTVRDAVDSTVIVPEIWVVPAALALVATSIVWTRRRALPFRIAQLGVPAAIVIVGLAALVCLVALPEMFAATRLVLVSVALAVVSVVAAVRRRVPTDRATWATAISILVILGIAGLATSAARPFELSTAPLALALIVCGVVTLHRDAQARSWPHLGVGVAVLLVPSLLADFGSTDLVRVITLGVLSVIVVVAAVALRWQAPLVVGSVVLIAHALAQSWPWIQGLYSAVPWWIWLGVGGIVLIAVAARYEHRVRNLRSFVGSIAALR
jgi:hypothetical protein